MNKKLLLSLTLMFQMGVFGQTPIFSPSSSISTYGSVNSPSAEQVQNVIDGNVATKYLDFFDSDGIGMTVNLGWVSKIVTSMSITTANDFPQRDPQYYQISGSNNGNNFTVIKEGAIVCNATRFNTTTYNFTNTVGYTYYRLVYTNQCNSSETIFQIAEVQLYESPLSNTSFETNNNFSVYPNPTNGSLFIHNATDAPIDLVIISDVTGKQLQSFSSNNLKSNEMNLNGLASGIYFVHITTGDKNIIKKIIKQ